MIDYNDVTKTFSSDNKFRIAKVTKQPNVKGQNKSSNASSRLFFVSYLFLSYGHCQNFQSIKLGRYHFRITEDAWVSIENAFCQKMWDRAHLNMSVQKAKLNI